MKQGLTRAIWVVVFAACCCVHGTAGNIWAAKGNLTPEQAEHVHVYAVEPSSSSVDDDAAGGAKTVRRYAQRVFDSVMEDTLCGALASGRPFSGIGVVDAAVLAFLTFIPLRIARALRERAEARARAAKLALEKKPDPWSQARAEKGVALGAGIAEFETDAFLSGAKVAFSRIQSAWDKRDLKEMADLVAPAMLREIQAQIDGAPPSPPTEIVRLGADLLSAGREGEHEAAAVLFEALVRENPEVATPLQVREIWRFVRPAGSAAAWRLDGIQEVS